MDQRAQISSTFARETLALCQTLCQIFSSELKYAVDFFILFFSSLDFHFSFGLVNKIFFKFVIFVSDIVEGKLFISFMFLFFPYFFVSGPCARLSWPTRQLLSARLSLPYCIVSFMKFVRQSKQLHLVFMMRIQMSAQNQRTLFRTTMFQPACDVVYTTAMLPTNGHDK